MKLTFLFLILGAALAIKDETRNLKKKKKKTYKSRLLVQFLGEGVALSGGLDDANYMADTSVAFEDANFPSTVNKDEDFLACFEIPMVDTLTKEVLGSGIDCLWGTEGGVAAISFYIFDCGGSFAIAGLTSAQPFTAGVGNGRVLPSDPSSPLVNLMTGSLPDDETTNRILDATGVYKKAKGGNRVSGALHDEGNGVYFSCMWDIYLTGDRLYSTTTCKHDGGKKGSKKGGKKGGRRRRDE